MDAGIFGAQLAGAIVNDRVKLGMLIALVALLIAVAGVRGFQAMRSTAEPTVSPDFQRLNAAQQQQLLDQAERDRRAVGKAPDRVLPEDRR
jgi:hypothetical protein